VPISGDCSRLGPPKPWARTFPEPREFNCYVSTLVVRNLRFPSCKDDAKQSKVSTNFP
jgi:hypothetical protein